MANEILHKWKKSLITLLAGAIVIGTFEGRADDFLIGTRGPTPIQFDHGINYVRKETSPTTTESFVNSNVVKYWTGKERGFFAIGSLPYKSLEQGVQGSEGFGDLTLKLGPRGTEDLGNYGSFHWITAAGVSMPLGNATIRPALGTGRYDFKGGFTTTWLDATKKNEVTTAFEYLKPLTFINNKPVSDEINTGFIFGRKLNEIWRVGTGLRGTYKLSNPNDGDYVLKVRVLARYTLPQNKMWHLEFIIDKSLAKRNMLEEISGALLLRYNLKP